jgi:hypothetical protein
MTQTKKKRVLVMDREQIREHMKKYEEELTAIGLTKDQIAQRIGAHYTNHVVKKYTREEMDHMWAEIYNTILHVPGGYWQIVSHMYEMPEFSHPRFKCLKSVYAAK